MSQRQSFRILAAAVVIGFSATTVAPAVIAAPISAQAEALPSGVSIGSTVTAEVESQWEQSYGVEVAQYSIADRINETDFSLISTNPNFFHSSTDLYDHYSFSVRLTDEEQVITQLVAKQKDNLVGGDVLLEFSEPLVVPAFLPWPDSVLDDRLLMPEIKMGVDEDGFQTFSFDSMSDARTTSDELEVNGAGESLEVWVEGKLLGGFSPQTPEICDSVDSPFAGKTLSIRSSYRLKADKTARHGEVQITCDAYIPLTLEVTQSKKSVKPGDTLSLDIDVAGNYQHQPVIQWEVDGKVVEVATGTEFVAPAEFETITATVEARNREGDKLVKDALWLAEAEKPVDPVDPVDPTAPAPVDPKPTDPDTKPVDPGVKPAPKPTPKPDTKPIVDKDEKDPIKAECEGLCDGIIDQPKPVKPSDKPFPPIITDWIKPLKPISGQPGTGIKPRLVKPKAPTSTPGVMDTLSPEALASLS